MYLTDPQSMLPHVFNMYIYLNPQSSSLSMSMSMQSILQEIESIDAIKTSNGTRLILDTLLSHGCRSTVSEWAINIAQDILKQEISRASNIETGLHFNASMVRSADFIGFDIQQIASRLEEAAPFAWRVIQTLLDANSHTRRRRRKGAGRDEMERGGGVDEMEGSVESENIALDHHRRAPSFYLSWPTVRILDVTLAHGGWSVSVTSIINIIKSLTAEHQQIIRNRRKSR